jgi:ribonuclease E
MEQAELNAAPVRAPQGRRGQGNRPRWQPPHWAVASYPPMLAGEPAADRPERPPAPESWALPSRPFMLRRDRHAPRWGQRRGGQEREPRVLDVAPLTDGAAAPHARPVPIEAGPPPGIEPSTPDAAAETVTAARPRETVMAESPAVADAPVAEAPAQTDAVETESVQAEPTQTELALSAEAPAAPEPVADAVPEPAAQPETQPVPANDVVSGPVVQPIVIGSESAPPPERKRGWWRRL